MSASWSPEAIATFAAAVLAALVGAVSLASGFHDSRSTRRRLDEVTRREHWWSRWTWAVEHAVSHDAEVRQIGLDLLEALAQMPWMLEDDIRISHLVTRGLCDRVAPPTMDGGADVDTDRHAF